MVVGGLSHETGDILMFIIMILKVGLKLQKSMCLAA
jgi:hypothetical protein